MRSGKREAQLGQRGGLGPYLVGEGLALVGYDLGHEGRAEDVLVVAQHVHRVLARFRRVVSHVAASVLDVRAVDLGLRRALDREACRVESCTCLVFIATLVQLKSFDFSFSTSVQKLSAPKVLLFKSD